MLPTGVNSFPNYALLTLHLAAPFESTVTVLRDFNDARVIAPTTTEEVTAVHPHGDLVTLPAPGPEGPRLPVRMTKVDRVFKVEEILLPWRLAGGNIRKYGFPVVSWDDLDCPVKPPLEPLPHDPERRHPLPTCFQGAGAGEAVALAVKAHVLLDGLLNEIMQEMTSSDS